MNMVHCTDVHGEVHPHQVAQVCFFFFCLVRLFARKQSLLYGQRYHYTEASCVFELKKEAGSLEAVGMALRQMKEVTKWPLC